MKSQLAKNVEASRREQRQHLLARLDDHPWSRRIDALVDRCIDAADRGDGLENALWQLSQEVGTILHHEAPSDFAATLSEPDVAAMDDLHNLMAMLGALMSATAVCTSGERATLFASWLVRVLAEVIRATRQAVLRLPKPRIASNASQSSSYVESFPLNAHAIRHQLQV